MTAAAFSGFGVMASMPTEVPGGRPAYAETKQAMYCNQVLDCLDRPMTENVMGSLLLAERTHAVHLNRACLLKQAFKTGMGGFMGEVARLAHILHRCGG